MKRDMDPAYNVLRNGLLAITTAGDAGPFMDDYREAGGGYEGLQAIASGALRMSDKFIAAEAAAGDPPLGGYSFPVNLADDTTHLDGTKRGL